VAADRTNPWGGDGDWRPTVGDRARIILEDEGARLRCTRHDLATLT
jgi:hypothetical protein